MRPMYASDLYALGVTCIYLMTGKSPKDIEHHEKTGEMLWQKHVKLSTSMLAILGKMLEPSVKHRYQSSEQVMRSLELAAKPLVSVGAPTENGTRTVDRPPPPPPGNGNQASPAQKLAQTIRENREKAATRSSFDPTVVDPPQAPRSGRKREVQRMDAATLLKTYQRGQKSFNDVDLSNLSLTNANLPSAVWENTNFSGSNLQNANLGKGKFVKTNFAEATLRGANLAKGQFPYANLQSADLRGANLSNAQMQNANLMGANLCGANLRGATISDEQMNMAKTNFLTIFPNGKRGGFW
jgi:serine/threonine protein kinase, bacterial